MRIFSIFVATGLLVGSAMAQSAADYLKLRAKQHIVQPTSGAKLDKLVGPSIVEIQGVVQGSFKSGPYLAYMVKRDDGDTLVVDCQSEPPEWLNNGEVAVRMLLHVNRDSQYDVLQAHLISAAPEADISKVDDAYWKGEAEKAKAKAAQEKALSRRYSPASRSGSEMYGWIGQAGRGHRAIVPNTVQDAYRNAVLSRNPQLSFEVADAIARHVIRFSVGYGVDARLVMAVITVESDFRPMSTSGSGAKGIGQLMPSTAAWMGVSDPYDLEQNIYGMIKLLRHHMDEYHLFQHPFGSEGYFNSLGLVLAAYNAGEGAVKRFGGVPPYRETQAYVARVIDTFRRLAG